MKLSGSKLITRGSSRKNISKEGYRYSFEIELESCDNVLSSTDVVCTWERGTKVVATAPFKVQGSTRVVRFDGARLRREVTLYKKQKPGPGFEPKPLRVALRHGSVRGRVIGKIYINFAEYADLETRSKRINAKLSSGSNLILIINSTLLGVSSRRVGRAKMGGVSSIASDESRPASVSETSLDGSIPSMPSLHDSEAVDFNRGGPQARKAEDQSAFSASPVNSGKRESEKIIRLEAENRELQRDVAELQDRFAREPDYASVVRELKEAKMALALLSIERDELKQLLRRRK